METPHPNAGSAGEDALLEQLAESYEVHPDLPAELLRLVRVKYPSLDVYGAKTSLERDIMSLIDKATVQAEAADPAFHDL
jgi:hypothetical protein